jgi:hypothetical protein
MKKNIYLLHLVLLVVFCLPAQEIQDSPQLYTSGAIYYRDRAQNELYTGDYREHYGNGTLKL